MTVFAWAGGIAAIAAGAVTLACAVAMSAMRDPLQRLHFVTPAATLAASLLMTAYWMAEPDKAAAGKASLGLMVLFIANGAIGQATGRAIRSRSRGART